MAVLVAFSAFGVMAFAQDLPEPPIKVEYVLDDGTVVSVAYVNPGETLTPHTPENPVKQDTETTQYTFKGWRSSYDGNLYYQSTQPVAPELAEGETLTITMTAEFSEKDISGNQSFWNFIESIFERLNLIFEYFATIFNW